MTETSLGFVLLENRPAPTGSALATQVVSGTEAQAVLIALDAERCRHLLVPTTEEFSEDFRSRALKLSHRTLVVDGDERQYADLWCADPRLGLVFERVVDDVVARLTDGAMPATVCQEALNDWRDLLAAAQGGTTLEDVVGLVGELEILKLLASATSPTFALSTWWGPARHVHDFYSPDNRAIEVKTTRTLDGDRVTISNLDQLDPAVVDSLMLAVVRIRPNTSAPALDDRIRQLIDSGFSAADLIDKVAESGHVFEAPVSVDTRYAVRDVRAWKVEPGFPGLRRSELSEHVAEGIASVKYELKLDVAGRPIPELEFVELMAGWTES